MGAIRPPENPADRMLSVSAVLEYLNTACERVGLDETRAKMMRQIFIYGAPVSYGSMVSGLQDLEPLPDVAELQMALESVQTWFHARPSGSQALNADVMMHMAHAGYPIEGGIA